LVFASFSIVAYQWHTSTAVGLGITVIVAVAFFVGVALADPVGWPGATRLGLWMVAEALLSRLLWSLVGRGGRSADESAAQAEETRVRAEVESALRTDERTHAAVLHDTAATTLLMVGLGEVDQRSGWFRDQLDRDIAAISAASPEASGRPNLSALLEEIAVQSRLTVSTDLPDALPVSTNLGVAVVGSVREALANVRRHANAHRVDLSVRVRDGVVLIEIRDDGMGFEPARIGAARRGIAHSIVSRMRAVGGTAAVLSSPGRGTVVRLEFRDA
jgi:signal transduction histidine kinase